MVRDRLEISFLSLAATAGCILIYLFLGKPSHVLMPVGSERYRELVEVLRDHRHAVAALERGALSRRISLPITQIDLTIDRRRLLAELFWMVSSGYTTRQSQVLAWVRYLQDRLAHPKTPPVHDNGQAIYDPLWILVNRVAHCGQTNRVLVDGLSAAGYRARVVQLKAHVAAEVWMDGAWRFLDADWLNLGQTVQRPDGTLPSAEEIHANPALLDSVSPDLEFRLYPPEEREALPPYQDMFATMPYYYVKTATLKQERNEYYGWNYYAIVRQ